MKLHLKIICFLLVSCFLAGCYTVAPIMIYNTSNNPNFTKKKQLNLNGYANLYHYECQAAYSPKSNIGLMANSYFASPWDDNNERSQFDERGTFHLEGAAGYYRKLKKQNSTSADSAGNSEFGKWYFDAYAGIGGGARKSNTWTPLDHAHDYYSINYLCNGTYLKGYSQASIYHCGQKFQFALSIQTAILHFNYYHVKLDSSGWNYRASSTYSLYPKNVLNINPSVTLKRMWNNFAFVFQFASNIEFSNVQLRSDKGYVYNVHNHYGGEYLNFTSRPFAVNIGIQFHFNRYKNRIFLLH
ncbi:MAG: hypothetical protein ACXVC6_10420 [Bacteroidia bacterium]